MECVKCGNVINPLRVKALPNTKICINCAQGTVQRKAGMPVTYGSGDHTWTETVIMDQTTYDKHYPDYDKELNEDEHIIEFGIE